jgi:hypothetical protein
LKLDADWVILSACNTAAGGATGAEALSGLARVFFYAQARALLVSHWEVDSDATVKLIIGAVSEIALDKRVGRAEALRRAMLAMIDGASRKRRIPPIGHRLCSWAKARRRASGYVCNCVAEPDRMVGGLPLRLRVGRIVSRALVGGLHHQYVRIWVFGTHTLDIGKLKSNSRFKMRREKLKTGFACAPQKGDPWWDRKLFPRNSWELSGCCFDWWLIPWNPPSSYLWYCQQPQMRAVFEVTKNHFAGIVSTSLTYFSLGERRWQRREVFSNSPWIFHNESRVIIPPYGDDIMAQPNPELVEFNRKNNAFWDDQKVLMDRRMADRAILETAVDAIASEAKRGVSIRGQMSFEKALEDAARAGHRFIQQQARSGGKALKRDPLQGTIIDIVRQDPVISSGGLLKELRFRQGDGIIEEINETYIALAIVAVVSGLGTQLNTTFGSVSSALN